MYSGAVQCRPVVCQTGVCVTSVGGCVYTNVDNGTSCENTNLCTINSCMNGQCHGVPVTCGDMPCMTSKGCDNTTGKCTYTPVVCANMPCMTSKGCNTTTGQCSYTPVVCADMPCMTSKGCSTTTGKCSYSPAVCTPMPCMNAVCSSTTGQCSYTPINCSDSNPCTTDSCVAGNCVHTPMNCTRASSNSCQFDNGTCSPTTGQCVYAVKPNGTTCDDHNLCTTKDKCASGQCVGTNTCCMNRTKSKCGICVSDCCSEYSKVLSFFGLHGSDSDVTEVSGGSCSESTVCCAPTSQSVFTYQSDHCVVMTTN